MSLLTERSRETFLASLFDALPQSVTWSIPVYDENGQLSDFQIRYANESGGMHIGLARDAYVGIHIFRDMELNSYLRELLWKQYVQVLRNGETLEDTYFDATRNKYMHVVRKRVEDGILTLATDVSTAQHALNDLRAQSELTGSILDASINAVYTNVAIRDAEGKITDFRIVQVNRQFGAILGFDIEGVVGSKLLDVFPNAIANGFFENAVRVVNTGKPWREVLWYEDAQLKSWYDISLIRLDDGFVATFNDVSALRVQQMKSDESARKLDNIFNSAQTRMLLVAPVRNESGAITDYRIRMVNRSYADFKKTTPEALEGCLVSSVFPSAHLAKINASYEEALTSGLPVRFDLHCDDPGRIFWVDVCANVVGADELLITINDYTRMRLLQLELQQKLQELERSNRNLEEFAYAASHDLKEPIRKVRFFVDRLRQKLAPEADSAAARDFDRLEVATGRMRDLVDDLLSYAQVSLRPRQLEAVSLERILHGVLLDLELEIDQQSADVMFQQLPTVTGHHRQLQQLFQNLVGNALKYHRPGIKPRIEISARLVKGFETAADLGPERAVRSYQLITVKDNGIGFEKGDAERIFQVFQRLHGNSEYRGTGVGLSIARKVVENHDGFIYAEGVPDEGATFYVGIPASE